MLALGSVLVSVTAPQVLSSNDPERDRTAKPQPRVAALAPAGCLAKGAGWNREVFQQPQTFSSHELALDNLGKAGSLMGWEGEGDFGEVGVELFS